MATAGLVPQPVLLDITAPYRIHTTLNVFPVQAGPSISGTVVFMPANILILASTTKPPATTVRTTLATVTTKPTPTPAPVSGAVKYGTLI